MERGNLSDYTEPFPIVVLHLKASLLLRSVPSPSPETGGNQSWRCLLQTNNGVVPKGRFSSMTITGSGKLDFGYLP